ncbi:hypothetical protein CR194_18015 [Salipaludibacillus keqinensis]|uniref:DUF4097 domain-containing protein n=1 Tax=Salipaludibacillus keqinensis TaxID=2045207 RepID=A0A323TE22_9BACI|nr:DUF4097 family beta strand repeat-containing protein [Salipaludibacillus keqinensis]PYZ92087.1 hypothetical protein CR194_18015 [Salipaludibacillus keqinensis]
MMNRIGRKSLGLLFLLMGGIFLANQWTSVEFVQMFGYVGSILFIAIIVEVILFYRSREPGTTIQFDKGAMVVLVIALVASSGAQYIHTHGGVVQGFSLYGWEPNKTSIQIEETYELANDVQSIQFSLPSANLKIVGGKGNKVKLTGTVKSNEKSESEVQKAFEKAREMEMTENTFHYEVENPSFSLFSRNHLSADFTIEIPENRPLDVQVTNGSVEVNDMLNDIQVSTTNGRADIETITGDVSVQNTNGIISVRNIEGTTEGITTNGRVLAENLSGDTRLKTTNGTVEVESKKVGGNWELETTNGNITIRVPEDSDVTVTGETTNGTVDGDLDWVREKEENFMRMYNEGSAVHNDGTYDINAKGTNGMIRVSFLN